MAKNSVVTKVKRFVPAGILYGIGFYFLLFIISLVCNSGFSIMGVEKSDVSSMVITRFWPHIVLIQLKILFSYLVIGLFAGAVSEFICANTFLRFKGEKIFIIVFLHLYVFILNMKIYPQLYSEAFYDRGGILRQFQLIVTDYVPMSLLAAVKVIIISVFLLSVALWVKKKVKPRLYFLAGLIFVILAYFSLRLIHADGNKGTNLLILASDSLRNDRVKNKSLMPNVNRLVENGVLFNNSFTSLPRTFPAMISFLTGKYPVNHGVRHMFPDKDKRDHLDSSFMNELRKQGYSTSVISDFAGDVFSRMDIGFESVKAPYFNFITIIEQRSLEIHLFLLPYITNSLGRKAFPVLKEFANNGDPFLLADEIKYELKKLVKKDKFACFVFFSTAHFPYASPYPYYGKYAVKGYRGKYKYSKPPTVYKDESIGERDIEQINGLYNGSVNAIDTAMGSITEFLKKNKVYDNTVIIITADHGENLYENGWSTGHGEHLRGPHVLNVPLVVKFKDNEYKGTRVNALTRDIDVMPTLFEYLSLKPLQNSDGVSLMPLIKKEKSSPALTAFSETGVWFSDVVKAFYQDKRIMYPDITGISEIDFTYNMEVVIKDKYKELINIAKHRMIDNGKYRLIYMPTRNGIIYELYDVKAKDGYKTDISQKMPAIVKKMKSELFNYMKNDRSAMR